jgi:hypothetical protein
MRPKTLCHALVILLSLAAFLAPGKLAASASGPGAATQTGSTPTPAIDCESGSLSAAIFGPVLDAAPQLTAGVSCGQQTCSSNQDCIFCQGRDQCVGRGVTCCGMFSNFFCSASQSCVLCSGTEQCFTAGSFCCQHGPFQSVCGATQACDSTFGCH